jgi:hypothetical protein
MAWLNWLSNILNSNETPDSRLIGVTASYHTNALIYSIHGSISIVALSRLYIVITGCFCTFGKRCDCVYFTPMPASYRGRYIRLGELSGYKWPLILQPSEGWNPDSCPYFLSSFYLPWSCSSFSAFISRLKKVCWHIILAHQHYSTSGLCIFIYTRQIRYLSSICLQLLQARQAATSYTS